MTITLTQRELRHSWFIGHNIEREDPTISNVESNADVVNKKKKQNNKKEKKRIIKERNIKHKQERHGNVNK